MLHPFRDHRRAELRKQPLSEAQRAVVVANCPHFTRLTSDERRELEGLIQIFLAEKTFEGCAGLELTEEMRLTIAAQACLLLLHRDTDIYPNVDSILVYPSAYRAPIHERAGFVVIDGTQARLGESWQRGLVVLSWDHVQADARNFRDGHNVVLHEFAHQLDSEDGAMDGTPELGARSRYTSWARVLGDEYRELAERVHAGRPSDIDAYGATNAPEFFAVLTEMFFEKPRALKKRHPELYAELRDFYRQDPAARA